MNRRSFLLGSAGGVVASAGAWAIHLHINRGEPASLLQRLFQIARPALTQRVRDDFGVLSVGRERIRQWFDGKCLRVAGFAERITSTDFLRSLEGKTKRQQEQMLYVVFCGRVADPDEIRQTVRSIADEIGPSLDVHWTKCCQRIEQLWQDHPLAVEAGLSELENRVSSDSLESIQRMVAELPLESPPAGAGAVATGIGRELLTRLPYVALAAAAAQGAGSLVLPCCFVLALGQFVDAFRDLLSVGGPQEDIQRFVSKRTAVLGNDVAREYVRALDAQVQQLHKYQETALEDYLRAHTRCIA